MVSSCPTSAVAPWTCTGTSPLGFFVADGGAARRALAGGAAGVAVAGRIAPRGGCGAYEARGRDPRRLRRRRGSGRIAGPRTQGLARLLRFSWPPSGRPCCGRSGCGPKGFRATGRPEGPHFLTDLRRGWDSLHVVTNNLFTFDLWLLSLTIAIAAVGLCLLVRAWRLALYLAALIVACVLGCTVILWSDPNLQLTDVNVVSRLVGTVALTVVAITPLALQRAWDAGEGPSREVAVRRAPCGEQPWRGDSSSRRRSPTRPRFSPKVAHGSRAPRTASTPRREAGACWWCSVMRPRTAMHFGSGRARCTRDQTYPARPGRLRQNPRVRGRRIQPEG